MLFAFLGALPYLGSGLLNALRVWHFLAMVVGVAAVGRIDVFAAATYVWLGWLVMVWRSAASASRSLRSVRAYSTRSPACGWSTTRKSAIGRVETGVGRTKRARRRSRPARKAVETSALVDRASSVSAEWRVLAAIVALALQPVRQRIFGWQATSAAILQLPLDLVWLGVIALVVAAFMAPLETLGWWAGWYGDQIDTSEERRPSKPCGAGRGRCTLPRVSRRHRAIERKVYARHRDVSRRAFARVARERSLDSRRDVLLRLEQAARGRSDPVALLESRRCQPQQAHELAARHVDQPAQRDHRRGIGRSALRPDVQLRHCRRDLSLADRQRVRRRRAACR